MREVLNPHSSTSLAHTQPRTPGRAWPRRLIAAAQALVCLIACICLSACTEDSVIKDGLAQDVAAIKNGDVALMQSYFGFDPTTAFREAGIDAAEASPILFSNLSVSVDAVEIQDDHATAQVTVTTTDYSAGLAAYNQVVTDYIAEHGAVDADDTAKLNSTAARLCLEAFASDAAGAITRDVTLSYELADRTWVLQNPADFADAVFGDAFDDINEGITSVDTGIGATS